MKKRDLRLQVELAQDDPQMTLSLEFVPGSDAETINDPFAICRWEDDGGAVGKRNADGE
jgi:hypothetical protein